MAEGTPGSTLSHSEALMHPRDRSFWVWITIFGTAFGYGIYSLIAKKYHWGSILTPIGLLGLLAMLTPLRIAGHREGVRFWLMLCALILTWAAIAYQICNAQGMDQYNKNEMEAILNQSFSNQTLHIDGQL